MRIAVLHSAYRSGAASGENRAVADEVRLLSDAGYAVTPFTPSYMPSSVVAAAVSAVWSRRTLRALTGMADSDAPDVCHVHNLFPNLSPSVLRSGIPTVMTLHNFRLACLPATFLRDGHICEDCLGKTPWRGVVHGCYRDSRAQSAVIGTSLSLHRAIGTFERVTLFAAVSRFVKDKLVESGLDEDRVVVRHNFSWPSQRRRGPGGYFLILGRLSVEKGLDTIVRGWGSRIPLHVVGNGPDRARLESLATSGIEFRGAVEAADVPAVVCGARALLVPSACYEGSPRVIAEAFAAGVPVIASRIGGLPEHVDDDISGILANPRAADAWADAVEQLEDDDTSERLGGGAFAAWQERFSPDIGLRSLESLYEEAIARACR